MKDKQILRKALTAFVALSMTSFAAVSTIRSVSEDIRNDYPGETYIDNVEKEASDPEINAAVYENEAISSDIDLEPVDPNSDRQDIITRYETTYSEDTVTVVSFSDEIVFLPSNTQEAVFLQSVFRHFSWRRRAFQELY